MSHQMVGIVDAFVGTDTRLWFRNRELVGDRVHGAAGSTRRRRSDTGPLNAGAAGPRSSSRRRAP
jgi:hypothetical protein